MIGPQITRMPCVLNQLDCLLRRKPKPSDLTAGDLLHTETEDVGHAFRI